jgi:hypothetical protein
LRGVREGHNVLGIFYGHPGVFVSPSHRAIAMARQEGYEARMLPGVSAEDYMFADLEFDPAMYGCMSCEANELLLTNRPLNPSTHNIIWQVGSVGVTTLQFDVSIYFILPASLLAHNLGLLKNSRFHLLVDHIEKDFGPDHKVVHYIGAVLPQFDTIINTFTVADLRKEDVVKQFNAISTLYIPPRDTNSTHSATALGSDASLESIRPLMRWDGPKPTFTPANGPRERDIIAQLDNHVTPEGHRTLHISPAMKTFMIDLALKPKFLKEYKAKPLAVVESMEGLTELEKFGLKLREEGPAYALMTATQSDIATGRQLTKDEIVNISRPLALGTVLVTAVLIAVILVS